MNSNIFSHACVKTGIKGSLVGHGFCLIVFWLVSFGPTLAEFLLPAISLAIISVCVGAYTGLLVVSYWKSRCWIAACIATATPLLTVFLAIWLEEYARYPTSLQNNLVYVLIGLVELLLVSALTIPFKLIERAIKFLVDRLP